MKRLALLALVTLAACEPAPPPPVPRSAPEAPKPATPDLRAQLRASYEGAARWLLEQQMESGAWGQQVSADAKAPSVAYTGLVVAALADGPFREAFKGQIDRAAGFIVSKQNPDGSFGEGPTGSFLKTYTTAIALMALSLTDAKKHQDALGNARGYLKHHQLKEGDARGGSGYGDDEPSKDGIKKTIANLSTTGFTAQGMRMSGLPQDDEFWKLVVEFARRCQNNSETNTDAAFVARLKEQGLSIGDDGGFYYAPVADRNVQKAKTVKLADKEIIQSYGSMTYEGIKTYLYAGLRKTDPEVKAAIDWVRKNWSVEAHPGFPYDATQRHHLRGLFYYYLAMARAMEAIGENPFRTIDGKEHDWAAELGTQLLTLQKDHKLWQNENPAWWEGDALLTTSYALNTLNCVLRNLK